MTIFQIIIYLVIGLILIIKSADYFVDAAVKIAELSKIPKLIIGATIVSLATTLPELFVSSQAAIDGSADMAIGNALGSILFNTAIILSIAAIFMAGKVDKKNLITKATLLIIVLSTLYIFSLDLQITWYEGLIQLSFVLLYTFLNVKEAKKHREKAEEINVENKGHLYLKYTIILILSAIGIRFGAKFLVDAAVEIAEQAGISKQVIGLTILAMGTSLPELVTTITSIIKKEQSLSIGNIIGANILNLTLVLGSVSLISKNGLQIGERQLLFFKNSVPQTLYIDLPIVFIVILMFIIPIFLRGHLKKWQGFVGLGIYFIYMTYLLMNI